MIELDDYGPSTSRGWGFTLGSHTKETPADPIGVEQNIGP